jgi:hypothetical protein
MENLSNSKELVAPCGMNCAICSGYLALKHEVKTKGVRMPYCKGCRPRGKICAFLKKKCELLLNNKVRFCYECKNFPCDRLLHLDKRYRTYFRMSMVENLKTTKEEGIQEFLKMEEEKWECPECGGVICCHNGICFSCSLDKLKEKEKLYRWES